MGGGVAGLETLPALDDLAGERVALTLLAPQPDFVYKPLLVEEPFDLGPAKRHELEPLTAEKGAEFVLSAVSSVRPKDHAVELDDGSTLGCDYLVVCAGGRFKPAIDAATTFPDGEAGFSADGTPRPRGSEGPPRSVHRSGRRDLVAAALSSSL